MIPVSSIWTAIVISIIPINLSIAISPFFPKNLMNTVDEKIINPATNHVTSTAISHSGSLSGSWPVNKRIDAIAEGPAT